MSRHVILIKKVLIVLCVLLFATPAFAETVTFTKEYTYQASDFDSKHSSRTLALEMVKRLLLEELGTYLVSETEVKNMQLTKDQVTTYSAGIVGAEVIDEKWNGKTFWLKAKVSADPKEVAKTINEYKKDYQKTKDLENLQQLLYKALKDTKTVKDKTQYDTIIKSIIVSSLIETGIEKINRSDYSKAILFLSQAIQQDPNAVWAYYNRGVALMRINNNDSALVDFNKTIELEPKHVFAYNNRGAIYAMRGDSQQALNDFETAIKVYPGLAVTYYNRGNYYQAHDDYDQALRDYNTAIKLDPNDALIYYNRGNLYGDIGLFQKQIQDYNTAIRLNPDFGYAYGNRGLAYGKSGNYKQAIKDFTEAIKLFPDSSDHYFNRGIAFHKLHNKSKAFKDYKTAARLGNIDAQNYLNKKNISW